MLQNFYPTFPLALFVAVLFLLPAGCFNGGRAQGESGGESVGSDGQGADGSLSDDVTPDDVTTDDVTTDDVTTDDVTTDDTTTPFDATGNEIPTGALSINELVSTSESGEDWFELTVIGDEPVLLSAYSIVDDNEDHEPVSLPDATLEPGDFYVVYAVDAEEESDGPSVGFKLGASDGLWLTLDEEVVDQVTWNGDAPEGTSFGRLPDGTGAFQTLKPTPGAPNEALDEPISPLAPFADDRVIPIEVELSAEAWAAIKAAPLEEEWHEGNLIFDGTRFDSVGVRVKGNSSLMSVAGMGSDRFSFKVDLNRYVDGQEISFQGEQGMEAIDMLVLNNGFKDPTLIREHLAYRVAREMGLPASRTSFVDFTIAGLPLGLYTLVEHVGNEFLDVRVGDHFENDDGDMYKPEMPDGELDYKGDYFGSYSNLKVENNEDTTDHAALLTLIKALDQGTDAEVEAILDVERALQYLAFNTLLVNLDSYNGMGHNYYLYLDGERFVVIPWDLNEAFGNFTCGCNRDGIINLYMDEPSCGLMAGKPLIDRLLSNEGWLNTYHDYLESYLLGVFSPDLMNEWIHGAADLIRTTVESDTSKFYSTEQFEGALVSDVNNVIGLEAFVAERNASLLAQLDGSLPSSGDGGGACGSNMGPGPGSGPGGDNSCQNDGDCDNKCPPNATMGCGCATDGMGGGHCAPICNVDSDCPFPGLDCKNGFCEPGQGDGGGNPKCPDGICDAFEQANPEACPEDCD